MIRTPYHALAAKKISGAYMHERKSAVDRLGAFPDAVLAAIITIMVLELKPPTMLSYVARYLFIAIVWINHHDLSRFTDESTTNLIWITFALLFMVSLISFSTAWVARTRLALVPVFVSAAVFVLVKLAYFQFKHHAITRAYGVVIADGARRFVRIRSIVAFGLFLSSMLISLKFPRCGFVLVCCAILLYLRPELLAAQEK